MSQSKDSSVRQKSTEIPARLPPSDTTKTEKTTLLDRVQTYLKNQPIVVSILVLAAIFGTLGTIAGGFEKVVTLINDWTAANQKTSIANCGNLNNVSSRVSSESGRRTLSIVNNGPGSITATWIDANGQKMPLAIIDENTTYSADTFDGHVWVIDSTVRCLGVVTIGTNGAEISRISRKLSLKY